MLLEQIVKKTGRALGIAGLSFALTACPTCYSCGCNAGLCECAWIELCPDCSGASGSCAGSSCGECCFQSDCNLCMG